MDEGQVAALREATHRGSLLLDEWEIGWAERMWPLTLDLAGCKTCTLGQLFGGYDAGLNRFAARLNLHGDEWDGALGMFADRFGFRVPASCGPNVSERDRLYAVLTAFWRDEIAARVGAAEKVRVTV